MPVKFYLSPQANKAGEKPIRVSIMVKGARYLTTCEYKVPEADWVPSNPDPKFRDKHKNEYVLNKSVNAKGVSGKIINTRLKKIEAHFADYELNQLVKPKDEDLKAQYRIALGLPDEAVEVVPKEKKIGLFTRLKEFIAEESAANGWAYATLQCWTTFTRHLTAYNARCTFDTFNETGINKFVVYLRFKCGLEEKSVQKQFNNLRWFLYWAIRKGYCLELTIKSYRPKSKVLEKPVIFLTKEELLHLYRFEIPKNGTKVKLLDMNGQEYEKEVEDAGGMSKTRDCFCFCAFTSLRYSDLANLKRTDIEGDTMYVTTVKTNDRLPINLNSFAKAILDKYKDENFPYGRALPVLANQLMNRYLKNLCELAGFNKPIKRVCYRAGERVEETFPKYEMIGTHAGRRTFICFALSSGIPPQVVMEWTGHSDYQAMKPYIEIAEKTKVDAMKLFDDEMKK